MDRFEVGMTIITTEDSGSDDWSPGVREGRKWGVKGVITKVHDSHGVCYRVHHEDDSYAYYEHSEVKRA